MMWVELRPEKTRLTSGSELRIWRRWLNPDMRMIFVLAPKGLGLRSFCRWVDGEEECEFAREEDARTWMESQGIPYAE